MRLPSIKIRRSLLIITLFVSLGSVVAWAEKQQDKAEFSRTTIDVGIVVSDAEKSVAFYSEALGFEAAGEFDVPASLGKEAGLSDNQPLHVYVMQLGKDESATKLKLMQFADAPGKKQDTSFIHSTLGISYLTVFVTDLDAALKRAAKHGVKPIAEGPVPIPGDRYLACVRDPDGNLIELIGPKQ